MQTKIAFKVQKVHLNEKNADKNAKNADRNEQTIQDKTIQNNTILDETR